MRLSKTLVGWAREVLFRIQQATRTSQLVTWWRTPARRLRVWLLVAPALLLAVGLAGFAMGSRQMDREVAAAQAERGSVTERPFAPPTSIAVQPTATSACLETAHRADELIHLLMANQRDRASDLLIAYTVASRQCRQDAFP